MKDEIIEIKTFAQENGNYQIFPTKDIKGNYNEFKYEKDLNLSNIADKDGHSLIILHQISKYDENNNIYKKLKVRIIKWLIGDKTIQKDIDIKLEKKIPIKESNLNFLYYDLMKVNEKLAFLFIFLFNHFYFFKIYEKKENLNYVLDYEELNIEDNYNDINKSNTYLFVGNSIYNENIIEYVFLEKPKNYFLFFTINLSSLDICSDELDCKIIKRSLDKKITEKYKLKKFWRGLNNDKYIFIEEKSFLMIIKDNNNESKMLLYPFEINYENNIIIPDKVPFLIKILDKMYIIVDFSKSEKSSNISNTQVKLAIFEIFFDEKRNIFSTKILQKINIIINNKDGKYSLNRISPNSIMIMDDYTIFFIIFNNNCLVDSIHQFNKQNLLNSHQKYYLNNYEKYFRVYIISSRECSISCFNININKEINNTTSNEQNKEDKINSININLNDYASFINSTIKMNLNNLINENRLILEKKYNSTKEKINGEKTEIDKNDKRLEKLSVSVVETIEEIPEDKKVSQYFHSNYKENKPYQKNQYKNNSNNYINNYNNNKNDSRWQSENQINYKNKNNKTQIPFYNNSNNNINSQNNINLGFNNNYYMNQKNNLNLINNINLRNQFEKIKSMNQLNQINSMNNINNIHNQNNNMNLINPINYNNYNANPQLYQNINPNYFG